VPAAEQFLAALAERLLPQFSSVEREAEELAEKEYERLCRLPGDENVDMGSLAERAQDVGITWYQNMMGTRQSLINLYAVGLRHLFEQQLYDFVKRAELCNRESANYEKDYKALKKIGVDVENVSAWSALEELRHLSNCVKHAEGPSARELKKKRPDLFVHPSTVSLPFLNKPGPVIQPLAGEDVYVSLEVLSGYVVAIRQFWGEVANHTGGLP
jgi:hypothetical protein